MAEREQLIVDFLGRAGWSDARRSPLAGDASFRRYERLQRDDTSAVLMDAPPPREDVRPFVTVAHLLRQARLSAPQIMHADIAGGLLLLEDLGDSTFTRVLGAEPQREAALYTLATDALIALHREFTADGSAIPTFDDERAIVEAERMLDWLYPAACGAPTSDSVRAAFRSAWDEVLPLWRRVPESLILFDYHVDNLIWLKDRPNVAACGLLDFQDGVIGPAPFDLVSLLRDVRRDVPEALAEDMIARYLAAFPALNRDAFAAAYAISGVQRNTRILGTFVRLWQRDGKPGYLKWLPRVWRMVEADLAHPALAPVRAWFDRHLQPALRQQPLPGTP